MLEETSLPQDIAAEKAVLGAILTDGNSIKDILDILTSDDFYREAHKAIFLGMLHLYLHEQPIDLITLVNYLRSHNKLDSIGGIAYISSLNIPSSASIIYHAQIVKGKSLLRKLVAAGKLIMSLAYESTEPLDTLDKAQHCIMQLSAHNHKEPIRTASINDLFMISLNHVIQNKYQGIYTGFPLLDHYINGFLPGQVVALCGENFSGKTALALQFLGNIAASNKIIYVTDTDIDEAALRLVCSLKKVSCWDFKTNNLDDQSWERIRQPLDTAKSSNIAVYNLQVSLLEIGPRIRELYRLEKMDMLILDLKLMKNVNAAIIDKIKGLADELGIVILTVLTQQFNGENLSIFDKADIVLQLSRKKLVISKHLAGPIGNIDIDFDDKLLIFTENVHNAQNGS